MSSDNVAAANADPNADPNEGFAAAAADPNETAATSAAPHPQPFDANLSPSIGNNPAENETITLEEWLASHEQESDQIPMAEVGFRNYNEGQYICFTRYDHLPWIYGIIAAGGIVDTGDGGKMYPFIYYSDNSQISYLVTFPNDVTRREAQAPTTVSTYLFERKKDNQLFYFLKYKPLDPYPQMIYYTRVVTEIENMPPDIGQALYAKYLVSSHYSNLINSSRTSSSNDTNSSSNDRNSRTSSFNDINYSPGVSSSSSSRSTSSRGSSVGGKKYRKKKNKTRRRNKKTKRRNNRKTKKR